MIAGFEWDPAKRLANLRKHGIDFVDAVQVFEGAVLRVPQTTRDFGEIRIIAIGLLAGKLLSVVYTPRGSVLRIISARRANDRETRAYGAIRPPEAQESD
jgi:uncharacterized DUF497 family protein